MSISLHPDTPETRRLAASPVATTTPAAKPSGAKIRSRLFTKYVALFVAVVGVALLSNGIFEVFFYYREHKAALIRIQHEQAEAAAAKIGQFIKEIESQVGWTTQLPWSAGTLEQRRFDALRLLRQVPAIKGRALIPPWTLHDLRRTFVTGMVELRVPPHVVEVTVNHIGGTRSGVAGTYNRSELTDERKEALERWATHVAGIVAPLPENVVSLPRKRRRK